MTDITNEPLSTKELKNYRNWLQQFNMLHDCAWSSMANGRRVHNHRFSDSELEEFRNCRQAAYVERETSYGDRRTYRGAYTPSLQDLQRHLIQRGDSTIWACNKTGSHPLLLMADIDNKEYAGDPWNAAQYITDHYFDGNACWEPSTSGSGTHIYFLLDCRCVKGVDIWEIMEQFAHIIRQDEDFLAYEVKLDGIYGLPTLWEIDGRHYTVKKRGNLIKLPYLMGYSLAILESLKPISAQSMQHEILVYSIVEEESLYITKCDMGRTKSLPENRRHENQNHPNAFRRKRACVDLMLQKTNGKCTLDEVLAEYHEHYSPTGMSPADVQTRKKKLSKILEHRRRSFLQHELPQSHPFVPGEFLQHVRQAVPAEEFLWKRREKLDHQRLADFIGIKIQDAFFKRDYGQFGTADRNTLRKNMVTMRDKGLVDWVCTANQHTKLMEISCKYGFLEVFREAIPPPRDKTGTLIKSGCARIVGPGKSLPDLRQQFVNRLKQANIIETDVSQP